MICIQLFYIFQQNRSFPVNIGIYYELNTKVTKIGCILSLHVAILITNFHSLKLFRS